MLKTFGSFESERLLLLPRKSSHAYMLFDYFCEPDLYHYMTRTVPPTAKYLAEGFAKLENSKEYLGWVLQDKLTEDYVGLVEMSLIENDGFIAYTIFKPHWGKGYAVEAVKAMMLHTQEHYSPSRFVIEMDTRNRASTKVAEKLGFHFVSTKNNACFLKNMVSHEFRFEKETY